MHLQIVIAFGLLLWWPDQRPNTPLISVPAWVLLFVCGRLLIVAALAQWISRTAVTRLTADPALSHRALTRYHRAALALRFALLAGVGADLFATSLPEMLASQRWLAIVPGAAHLTLLLPYVLGLLIVWWLLYPVEHASRDPIWRPGGWTRRHFVMFNLRHQVLIVALPLAAIVITYAATREYRRWFVSRIGSPWAPEAILGAVAVVVFVLSPLMLRRIWATSSLPDGLLRRKLLDVCQRIGLKVRDILVWHSDGLLVNAAVMGLFPRIRYILLSDTLLESMTHEEVEAVFGHEAGHVRHHHIQYFLLFALASMLIVSGIMELLTRTARRGYDPAGWHLSAAAIEVIGLVSVLPIWAIAFGWISRRFERQADAFGAFCAAHQCRDEPCRLPCVVHDDAAGAAHDKVCATGASTFVRALRKVAVLNGIPSEERSWRHSSIASRMRFLTALSGDPMMTRRFVRSVRIIKLSLILSCTVGLIVASCYLWHHPDYRRLINANLVKPLGRLIH